MSAVRRLWPRCAALAVVAALHFATSDVRAQEPSPVPAWPAIAATLQPFTNAAARAFGLTLGARASGMIDMTGVDGRVLALPAEARSRSGQFLPMAMQSYRLVERQFAAPPGDMGTALAAFIAGSWSAARQSRVGDDEFRALQQQMQRIVREDLTLKSIPTPHLHSAQLQLAALGTLLTILTIQAKTHGDALPLQNAGAEYLRGALGVDAARVSLAANGLGVLPASNATASANTAHSTAAGLRVSDSSYAYSAAPGAGMRRDQVETVMYDLDVTYTMSGATTVDHVHLLLTDGSVHNGMPVAP